MWKYKPYLAGNIGHFLKYKRCANIKVNVIIIKAPQPPSILIRIIVEAGTSNILESEMDKIKLKFHLRKHLNYTLTAQFHLKYFGKRIEIEIVSSRQAITCKHFHSLSKMNRLIHYSISIFDPPLPYPSARFV